MAVVAGVDFGTLSVRVSIVDGERGMLASAVSEYPLHRKREDPEYATQSHDDHMRALAAATREAIKQAGISGDQIAAIALDTTGSSVIPVDQDLQPLGEYYLWCDHRAKGEAEEITAAAHREMLEAIEWCGGVYSSEWGFSKLLHWLRHNPEKREDFASAFEHCDMVAATLSGISDPKKSSAASVRWVTNGSGTRSSADYRRRIFWAKSIRCWRVSGENSTANTRPQRRWREHCLLSGPRSSG